VPPVNKGGPSKDSEVVSTSVSTRSEAVISFMDSIESAAVRQLIQRFPITEMAARNIKDSDWVDSIFVTKQEGNQVKVTVPRNIETFTDSLFMMSILKIFQIKEWIPVLSTKDLPKAVLETKEGAFFAGFVSQALRETTGPMNDGTSKYAKGVKAHQIFSVEKSRGKARHLKNGGMSKVTERLSSMKGFTQEWWGLRGSIVTLFKSLPSNKVTNLDTYVLSKSELQKIVKTKLQSENGGCFRPEELQYLATRHRSARTALTGFLSRFENPNEELATSFDQLYAPVKTLVEAADNEIKALLASRARILFPQDKKKSTVAWAKKPLVEKLSDISEEKKTAFVPESLPGISVTPVERAKEEALGHFLPRRYATVQENELAGEVILSWFTNYADE
jgi:hypothetical protein